MTINIPASSQASTSFVQTENSTEGASSHTSQAEAEAEAEAEADYDHRFACNICLEQVSEPVVTRCGHLYCWPCLYHWLQPGMTGEERDSISGRMHSHSQMHHSVDRSRRMCPVCKSDCSVLTIVPIYVREANTNNTNKGEDKTRKGNETHAGDEDDANTIANENENDQENEDVDDIDDIPYEVIDVDTGEDEIPILSTQQSNTGGTGLRRRRTSNSSHAMNTRTSINTGTGTSVYEHEHEHDNREMTGTSAHDADSAPSRPRPAPTSSSLPLETPTSAWPSSSTTTRNNNAYEYVRPNRRPRAFEAEAILDILLGIRNSHAPIPSIHNRNPSGASTSDRGEAEAYEHDDSPPSMVGNLLLVFGSIVLLILLLSS